MLTLRAAKGADYYERAEFAADDYYAERGQVRGTWAGRGAAVLGLTAATEEGALGVLLDGRDPASGGVLAGTARRTGGNVAFDLTFAAPKSVSVLAAVGDEPVRRAVLNAHAAGVEAAARWRAGAAEPRVGARELRDALGRARPVTRAVPARARRAARGPRS